MNSVSVSYFFKEKFKPGRLKKFARIMEVGPESTILDVGGDAFDWHIFRRICGYRPRVTLLNLERPASTDGYPLVIASALELPFADGSFDIVYSNSMIEHLYNRQNQGRCAAEMARVGKSYFVQTPNRWFPIEPHYLSPFIHYFPARWQLKLLRNFTVWGLLSRPSAELCRRDVEEIRLLDASELQELFPAATIHSEHFCGLVKSIVAVSGPRKRQLFEAASTARVG